MDIRIDVGDKETDDSVEDELLEDEVAEVEEEPFIPDEQPQGVPPQPSKKPVKRKKTFMTIAVVLLVVISGFILYTYLPRAPTDMDLFATESGDGHGLRLNALISSESASESSGKAEITITFAGVEAYTNKNWPINSNNAVITIPYSEFVMGNGFYTIDVDFQGVSDTTTYDKVDFVIEDARIENDPLILNPTIINGQPEFTLRGILECEGTATPKDAEVKVVEIVHEDGIHQVTSGIGVWESVTNQGQYEDTFEYDLSGNYTVTIEIRNNDVKTSSDYYEYEVEDTVLINAFPVADIETTEGDGNEDGQVVSGTTVHFDGGGSIDDSDNSNNIVEYEWFFEDTQEYNYGVEVNHQFNIVKRDPENPTMILPWMVTLTVTDNGHGEEGKTHTDYTLIKVTPT